MKKIYHGTTLKDANNIMENGIKIICEKTKKFTDFGPGFYTTPDFNYAVKTARLRAMTAKEIPAVVIIEYDDDKAKSLNHLVLLSQSVEWAQFVINNRAGQDYMRIVKEFNCNLNGQYDIVEGDIADNQIASIVKELKRSGEKATEETVKMLYEPSWPIQISFHTDVAKTTIKPIALKKV